MIRGKRALLSLLTTIMFLVLIFPCKIQASSVTVATVKRLGGSDRYDTCVKVAQDGWSSSYYAILTYSQNYADALSAVPLAKKYDAPILLTDTNSVPSKVINELLRLHVGKVFILGGTGVVSSGVEAQLNSLNILVERIGGEDRYETSIKVAEKFGNVDTLTVATGEDYADALSIGPAAAAMGVPVILVPKNIMPDVTKNYIKKLYTLENANYSNSQIGQVATTNTGEFVNVKVFVMGDNNVISDNVVNEFENSSSENSKVKQFGNVERIIGQDKYERNINAIARFIEKSSGTTIDYNDSSSSYDTTKTQYSTKNDLLSISNLYVASGEGYADALSGAALAAKTKSPIILSGDSNSKIIKNFLLTKIPNYNYNSNAPEYLTILGGEAVMPSSRVNNIFSDLIIDKTVGFNDSSTVQFKDKQFEKAVRDKLGMHSGDIHLSDISNITSLDLSNQGIGDITGIENFISLQSLDLSYNQITDIAPLTKLYLLDNLNLSHNKIEDISYISNLTKLKQLNLSDNNIDTFSYSRSIDQNDGSYDKISQNVFQNLTALTFLDLSNSNVEGTYNYKNKIYSSDIYNLRVLINLVSLNLKGTDIGTIDNLSSLINLDTLNINNADITSLYSLNKLTNITHLDIGNNPSIDSSDLEPLQYLYNLKYLNACNDKIDDLTYLNGLTNLNTLYLEDNPIKDYTPILPYYSSLYYRDFNISSNNGDSTYSSDSSIDNQIKNEINNFEGMYSYDNYENLKYRQLYRSYDESTYKEELKNLYTERDWLNSKIVQIGLSTSEINNTKDDLSNLEDTIADINKKESMNKKIRDLENQLSTSRTPINMESIIDQINYVYSDYRYDYYRNEVARCNDDIQKIEQQIQVLVSQSPNYGSASSIDKLRYMLTQRQKDKNFANEKVIMYENYRNFFNAVTTLLQQN